MNQAVLQVEAFFGSNEKNVPAGAERDNHIEAESCHESEEGHR